MKKVINKTVVAVILAITMLLALLGGLCFANGTVAANADGKDVTVKIEAVDSNGDTVKSFAKGTTFNLKITVNTVLVGDFASITLNVGPTASTGGGFDAAQCAYFTVVPASARALLTKSTNINNSKNFTDSSTAYNTGFETRGLALISIANSSGVTLACTEEITFQFGLTIADDVPDGTDVEIGIYISSANEYTYTASSNQLAVKADDTARFEVQTLSFTVREPSSDNDLSAIKVGQGDTEADLDEVDLTDPDNLTAKITDLTKPISIMPTPSDENATVVVKTLDNPDGVEIPNGEIGKIDIPSDGKITIVVTAEDGTPKEYTLNVSVVAAQLTALSATPDSATTGATKGLKETFDSATFAYTVVVPNDSTKVTVSATVSTGHSESATISLARTGNCTIPATAMSGVAFDVTNFSDGDVLTLIAKADDGNGTTSEKSYTLTFDVVDVDTSITLTVVGTSTGKIFANNSDKATEKNVDYYYIITGETNASSKVTVAGPATADIELDGVAYTAVKTLTAGEHTVNVTAQAGNVKEYTFILKQYTPLQLKAGIVADFIYENKETAGFVYRTTYKEKGLTHGKDDLDFERLVIGQIKDYTTINTFLANFDDSLKTSLKIYNAQDELVYDMGVAAGTFAASDLDNEDKGVGTGWKLEYIIEGEVEETIYLSVLGDMNGDGKVTALDIPVIGNIIKENETVMIDFNAKVELRLASYIVNGETMIGGEVRLTASEIVPIGQHIRETKAMSENFYTGN